MRRYTKYIPHIIVRYAYIRRQVELKYDVEF